MWRGSELFAGLRQPQSGGACTSCSAFDACQGGCMAAKFFTGLPLDGPDPECVRGFGEAALATAGPAAPPRPTGDHSHRGRPTTLASGRRAPVPVSIGPRPGQRLTASTGQAGLTVRSAPDRACDESPLAGFTPPPAR